MPNIDGLVWLGYLLHSCNSTIFSPSPLPRPPKSTYMFTQPTLLKIFLIHSPPPTNKFWQWTTEFELLQNKIGLIHIMTPCHNFNNSLSFDWQFEYELETDSICIFSYGPFIYPKLNLGKEGGTGHGSFRHCYRNIKGSGQYVIFKDI